MFIHLINLIIVKLLRDLIHSFLIIIHQLKLNMNDPLKIYLIILIIQIHYFIIIINLKIIFLLIFIKKYAF